MPILDFPNSQNNPVSESNCLETKLTKSLHSLAPIQGFSSLVVVGPGLIRSFPNAVSISTFSAKSTLSTLSNFRVGPIGAESIFNVSAFVNTSSIAVPKGRLLVAITDPLLNPTIANPTLHSYRLARLDSLPVFIVLEGQRLEELFGVLEVKGRDLTTQNEYGFQSSMIFADATDQTQIVERRSGRIQINPQQTEAFPLNREILCQYKFTLSDSNGRTYTIDRGSFTVYPALI